MSVVLWLWTTLAGQVGLRARSSSCRVLLCAVVSGDGDVMPMPMGMVTSDVNA